MTAEEFLKETSPNDEFGLRSKLVSIGMERMICEIMVRFARIKAQEALEAALNNAELTWDGSQDMGTYQIVDKDSILNSYDLNSIK
jgi:hypothetical protein